MRSRNDQTAFRYDPFGKRKPDGSGLPIWYLVPSSNETAAHALRGSTPRSRNKQGGRVMRLLSACFGVALWSVAAAAQEAPLFQVEPFWPKPLPENWILGQVSGIAVGLDDTIWLVHRPAT